MESQTVETPAVDITKLSPAEQKALIKQLEELQKKEAESKVGKVEEYKTLVDNTIVEMLPRLMDFAKQQQLMVDRSFGDLSALIELKQELWKVKGMQDSNTFTHREGKGSITVGYNTIIAFDGTEGVGVQKIKEFIASLLENDEKRKVLVNLLNTFMKPDKNGNLNPTRITEMQKQEAEINDPLFSEGIEIIVKAQHKSRTSCFVKGWQLVTDEAGKDKKVTFSISA